MVQRYKWHEDGMEDEKENLLNFRTRFVTEDDYAALEAERDELRRQNEEMAGRLRRIAEVRPAIIPRITHDDDGFACSAAIDAVDEALSGPVPPCRRCEEADSAAWVLSGLAIKANQFVPPGELWVNPKWPDIAAQEGGSDEKV